MTMQQGERLRYRGRDCTMTTEPLSHCHDAAVRNRMALLQMASTALRRGYCGAWEIRRGKLWLSALRATIREYASDGHWEHAERGIDWLFPGVAAPVLADWFTGEIESPRGRAARTGLFSIGWPHARVFHVERGTIVGTELRDNRVELRHGIERNERLRTYLDSL